MECLNEYLVVAVGGRWEAFSGFGFAGLREREKTKKANATQFDINML